MSTGIDSFFAARVQEWLADNPSWIRQKYMVAQAVRFQKIRFRPVRLIPIVGQPALLSSAPLIAEFGYGILEAGVGMTVAGLLFAGHLGISAVDKWSKDADGSVDKAEGDIANRVGDLLACVKSSATLQRDRGSSVTATLGIIEGYARLIAGAKKGDLSVSLAMYDGTGSSKMKMLYRQTGSERPVNRRFTTDYVLGHYAVQAGTGPRVVNNMKYFGKKAMKSPTGSNENYNSILFFPITSNKNGEKQGFISVDCKTKYAFFGSKAEKLTYLCTPLVEHVEDLI